MHENMHALCTLTMVMWYMHRVVLCWATRERGLPGGYVYFYRMFKTYNVMAWATCICTHITSNILVTKISNQVKQLTVLGMHYQTLFETNWKGVASKTRSMELTFLATAWMLSCIFNWVSDPPTCLLITGDPWLSSSLKTLSKVSLRMGRNCSRKTKQTNKQKNIQGLY